MVKIWKWWKLLNSVPFIKKTLVNHVYIWILSSWLTFTVLQWMKRNFKITQFSWFLLMSEYAIQVKIWKWLKLLNSVLFIKKTLVNQVYILRWIFAGGKHFIHLGTLLVTVDVFAPNLIGWIWEHQCTCVVHELWDADFCFSIWQHFVLDSCAWCKLTEYWCRMWFWEWTRTFQIWIARVDINYLVFTIFLDRLTVIEYSMENQRLLRS